MRYKILILCIITIVLVACVGTGIASASSEENLFVLAGQFFKEKQDENVVNQNNNKTIVAKYDGQPITASTVEYQKNMNILRGEESAVGLDTDLEIINSIIKNMILLEEAERLGFSATDDEIDAMLQNVTKTYSVPQGKEMMDAYFQGAGITFDEYIEMIREQCPRVIARQKLLDYIGQQYCEEHGIEFTKINPPAEMTAAQDAYVEELFEKKKDKIEYFIDIPEVS